MEGMTVGQMLAEAARKAKASPPPDAEPTALVKPLQGFLGRRDGQEPLPWEWPSDPAAFCQGNELGVLIDENEKGWIVMIRNGHPPLYLMGPLRSLNLPF